MPLQHCRQPQTLDRRNHRRMKRLPTQPKSNQPHINHSFISTIFDQPSHF
jgi:hypothetical protein